MAFKLLNTETIVSTGSSAANVFTYYVNENIGDILSLTIPTITGTRDGVDYEENELLVLMTDGSYPSDTNIYINSNGEVEIIADDAANYSIDSNGDLIYTY